MSYHWSVTKTSFFFFSSKSSCLHKTDFFKLQVFSNYTDLFLLGWVYEGIVLEQCVSRWGKCYSYI